MENILLITNYKLNQIIDFINKQKDIDPLNKADTNVDNKISEEILTSINTLFESILPIIEFFTNPKLTEIFFEQNVAITELLKIHYEYIESTKDSPNFNQELLEDYLVNFYSYKNTPFAKYLTSSETIRHELTKLKFEFQNMGNSDTSVEQAMLRGELVGGGITDRVAILSSMVLLLGASFIGITQASEENNQVDIQRIFPKPGIFPTETETQTDTRYAVSLYQERVTVLKDVYTSNIVASFGAVIVSAGVIGSLSRWFYGDDNIKAWGELLQTIAGVNSANDEICTDGVQALSRYFQTFEEAFDAKEYDVTQDETFDEIVAAADEAVEEAVVKVETEGLVFGSRNNDFALGPPENKDMRHVKSSIAELMTPHRDEVLTPAEAAHLNSDIHDAVSEIIKNKYKKASQMKLFEKQKLFELGRLCNTNLFSGFWGEEAFIRVDLHNNAFRTATYENILDNFARNPSEDKTQLVQYAKLQHVLKVLNPIDLLGKLSGILDQQQLSTHAVIQQVNSMLTTYKTDLEIIRDHADPSGVFEDIEKRKEIQAQEELRRIQAEFDMEVSRNATKLAEREAAELVNSRLTAANYTSSTLEALSSLWSSWTSGVTGVVLDPAAAVVDKTVSTVSDLAVGQTYTLFLSFMKIAGMATVTLAAGIAIVTCFNSSPAISSGLASMIPRAAEAAGDVAGEIARRASDAAGTAAGHAADAVGTAAAAAADALGTAAGHAAEGAANAAGHGLEALGNLAYTVGNSADRILSTGRETRWDHGGSSRRTKKKRGGGLGFSASASNVINDDSDNDDNADANVDAINAANAAANAAAAANGRILSTGRPSRWDTGGNFRHTKKKRRTKKNKRTKKNRRTRKNKRAKKNKNKTRKK